MTASASQNTSSLAILLAAFIGIRRRTLPATDRSGQAGRDQPAGIDQVCAVAKDPHPSHSANTTAQDDVKAATEKAALEKELGVRGIDDPMFKDLDPQTQRKVATALKSDPI